MTAPLHDVRPQLDLGFIRRGERTILDRRLFRWPYVLTRGFALDRAPAHMLTVILQTGSGALHGEDRLSQRLTVGTGAAAHLATQGATAVHRAKPGRMAQEHVTLKVEAGGCLEYMPEGRILFPDAALDQRVEIDCAPGGTALVTDAFTLHDPGGQGRCFRRLVSGTVLRCGGEPVLIDRQEVGGPGRGVAARFTAFGTFLLAVPGRPAAEIASLADQMAAAVADGSVYGAASPLPGGDTGVGLRLAGADLRAVRAGLRAAWIAARRAMYDGAPPRPQRKVQPDGAELF